MKERGILFSAPMVRAILAGTKTQTRRVVKTFDHGRPLVNLVGATAVFGCSPGIPPEEVRCPYGVPGDRLWVRETWYCDHAFERDYELTANSGRVGPRVDPDKAACEAEWRKQLYYRADGEAGEQFEQLEGNGRIWKPAIHLPRWASRITLEVTEVRVQRLQEISEEDAKAEGVAPIGDVGCPCEGDDDDPGPHLPACAWSHIDIDPEAEPYRAAFAVLWDAINGDRASWASNPWVWAISFRRVG